MIRIEDALPITMKRAKSLPVGGTIKLLSYKKDRSVSLLRQGVDAYLLIEKGFVCNKYLTANAGLKKTLKKLVKREFPRSRKLWLKIQENDASASR